MLENPGVLGKKSPRRDKQQVKKEAFREQDLKETHRDQTSLGASKEKL